MMFDFYGPRSLRIFQKEETKYKTIYCCDYPTLRQLTGNKQGSFKRFSSLNEAKRFYFDELNIDPMASDPLVVYYPRNHGEKILLAMASDAMPRIADNTHAVQGLYSQPGSTQPTRLETLFPVKEESIFIQFLGKGEYRDVKTASGITAVHIAAHKGFSQAISFMTHQNFNLNHRTTGKFNTQHYRSEHYYGETPLHLAVRYGHLSTVGGLIRAGVKQNIGTDDASGQMAVQGIFDYVEAHKQSNLSQRRAQAISEQFTEVRRGGVTLFLKRQSKNIVVGRLNAKRKGVGVRREEHMPEYELRHIKPVWKITDELRQSLVGKPYQDVLDRYPSYHQDMYCQFPNTFAAVYIVEEIWVTQVVNSDNTFLGDKTENQCYNWIGLSLRRSSKFPKTLPIPKTSYSHLTYRDVVAKHPSLRPYYNPDNCTLHIADRKAKAAILTIVTYDDPRYATKAPSDVSDHVPYSDLRSTTPYAQSSSPAAHFDPYGLVNFASSASSDGATLAASTHLVSPSFTPSRPPLTAVQKAQIEQKRLAALERRDRRKKRSAAQELSAPKAEKEPKSHAGAEQPRMTDLFKAKKSDSNGARNMNQRSRLTPEQRERIAQKRLIALRKLQSKKPLVSASSKQTLPAPMPSGK